MPCSHDRHARQASHSSQRPPATLTAVNAAALAATSQGLFALESAQTRIQELHALVAPYVVGEQRERAPYTLLESPEDFQADLDGETGLLEQIAFQHQILSEALGNGGE